MQQSLANGLTQLAEAEAQLDGAEAQLDGAEAELNTKKQEAENQFAQAKKQLDASKAELDQAAQEIQQSRQTINNGAETLEQAKAEYADGLADYEAAKAEAEEQLAEAEEKLADARAELDDGWQELSELAEPTTYLLERDINVGYVSFENDAGIVEGISRVFPIFFFMVAALVCITTMTRMVDEQRTQIGTLKALGYSNRKIAMKYISYSGSAAIIGCVLGFCLGSKLFPWTIWQVYGLLYNQFAPIRFVIDWKLAGLSLLVSLICTAGATWLACYTELMQKPAALMRPRAPQSGKKIWLEHVTVLWKRMKFLHKVSARNIFRFKKRMVMMLLGIGGCTALIVTGFGISDSIVNIAADQYDNILTYDYAVTLSDGADEAYIEAFREETADMLDTSVFVETETVDAIYEGGTKKVNIIATSDMDIEKITGLFYKGQAVEYPEDGKVLISNSIAEAAGVKAGDTLTLKISDTETKEVVVGGIFQNYVYHYMFMTGETYAQIFGETGQYKTILATAKDKSRIYETSAALTGLESGDRIEQISVTNDFKTRVKNMLNSLNYVVALVIFCACALAFVVLYNLGNINLAERVREIATLQVLGFYPRESNAYVFRENIFLTLMGTVLGLPAGYFLHNFVMRNIRIEMVCFNIRIQPQTYIYAVVITLGMAFLVDLILRRKIRQINMTESLKSVE
jgi:putative ABC transport system permease protein